MLTTWILITPLLWIPAGFISYWLKGKDYEFSFIFTVWVFLSLVWWVIYTLV